MPTNQAVLEGRSVLVSCPDVANDAPLLFAATHGVDADTGQWTYMSFGPFRDSFAMEQWMRSAVESSDPMFYMVRIRTDSRPVGMVSFMNIQPGHRTVELGNIWFIPQVRRSTVTTETIFLLLKHCFDDLGFRRVEWKCDDLNVRSKSAAVRLGFSFEGLFRQHYIVKGHSRDTAWFAMLDGDWPRIRTNFEQFLYDPNCSHSLSELNK